MLKSEVIKSAAAAVGFDNCGMAQARALPQFALQLRQWVSKGYHGEMHYMEQHLDKRADPTLLVPKARTVICVVLSYPNTLPQGVKSLPVARFACREDYHTRLKRMLWEMIAIVKQHYPEFEGRPFVDTAPISDKLWAAAAGLGWIGKNSLLITPQHGSWVNIGEIVTPQEVDHYDSPIANGCEGCEKCVKACPNHAIVSENSLQDVPQKETDGSYCLNATRCTAYNTIENRAETLPQGLHTMGYAFGCDCCQLACPYNQRIHKEMAAEDWQRIAALSTANAATFKQQTKKLPLSRITFTQWVRNQSGE